MILYAESSAVLAWLLGEDAGATARSLLSEAGAVFASRLTLTECERGLTRLAASGSLAGTDTAVLRQVLAHAGSHWIRFDVAPAILDRAGEPFPVEPVRTLDAVHLATVLQLRAAEPRLEVLTLDRRIRKNAERLGIPVRP